MVTVSIICLIYKSTKYAQFISEQVKKYINFDSKETGIEFEFYFVANDANRTVLDYLKDNNVHHYVFNNTEENIKKHNVTEYYVNNVYRAWNHGASVAKGEYLLFINSDMAFSDGWFDNLFKHINDEHVCVTSRLVESGRYLSGTYGITNNCGQFLRDYDEKKFVSYAETIKDDKLCNGGLFMPLLIKKDYFFKVGGYPEGNICPGSDIFNPQIAKKGKGCIPGDTVLMKKLEIIGVYHKTAFDSVVYHFQNGEMFE